MSGSWNGKKPVSFINILHQKSKSDSSCDGTKIKIFDFIPDCKFDDLKTTKNRIMFLASVSGQPSQALNQCINLYWLN